jgi:vancomycin permeability regulator SanA
VSSLRRYAVNAARAVAACAALAVLFVAGTNLWVRATTSGHAVRSVELIPARTIAIVPGSGTSNKEVKAALETRVEGALALYRSGRATTILVSGIDTDSDPETSAMRAWLEARGVSAQDIVTDDLGVRTRATMYRAAHTYAVERAIVCTEALHMPRALYLARQNGIDAVGFALTSPLSSYPSFVAIEALKTTLAFVEETVASATGTPATTRTAQR